MAAVWRCKNYNAIIYTVFYHLERLRSRFKEGRPEWYKLCSECACCRGWELRVSPLMREDRPWKSSRLPEYDGVLPCGSIGWNNGVVEAESESGPDCLLAAPDSGY
ncbi:hypothetical protein OGATHE_000549 [Ogataea polymorpha]|uniref:Uncharacterized protein n=1 Tax=Ogataea polymorpha TaxID=460523 RepID=A0A9P8PUL8_9ASCO|nr:hypothetical protein OGATHE_000549 [Ogataea polymorpha]